MITTHRVQAASSPPDTGVERDPWKQWGLAIITFGVYAAINHFRVNRELRDFGIDVDPTKALLAFFPGVLILVPYLITAYRTGERIAVAQETVGLDPTSSPERSALSSLLLFLQIPYQQDQLNRVWAAENKGTTP